MDLKKVFSSWEVILPCFIILGILSYSYINHILLLFYSTLGLLSICLIMIQLAHRKYRGGWNGLSIIVILWPFVFAMICLTFYTLLQKSTLF